MCTEHMPKIFTMTLNMCYIPVFFYLVNPEIILRFMCMVLMELYALVSKHFESCVYVDVDSLCISKVMYFL